jgi:hypothetical protein
MPAGICTVEVRGSAGGGDDDFHPAPGGFAGDLHRELRRAVRGGDAVFVRDAEGIEHVHGVFHGFPVGFAAHDDGDEWCGVVHIFLWMKMKPELFHHSRSCKGGNFFCRFRSILG